jgi:cyclophilin family peptidyl-prolyl cis-trans isomerase
MRRLLAIALLLLLAAGLAACGDSGEKKKSDSGGSATAAETAPAQTTPDTSGNPPVGANGCQQVQAPPQKPDGGAKKPSGKLDASKKWTLEVRTSCGVFTIALDLKSAPNASASMVSLARAGFFEDTVVHRIVPGFVIQGGDPTGTGMGGPGYSTVDPPPSDAKYTLGVVAMAKTEQEKPGTAGSQFYIVTGQDAGLPPDYAVIGKVTKGLGTVKRIGELGDPSTEQPTQPVVIHEVTARSS